MAEVVIAEFEIDKLTAPALKLLKAAVTYALENRRVKLHTMSINTLCRLAGLPSFTAQEFSILLQQARRALVVVEVMDTASPDRDDLPYASWPVFNEVRIDGSSVAFEICRRTFDEKLVSTLLALEPSGPQRNRIALLIEHRDGKRSSAAHSRKPFLIH